MLVRQGNAYEVYLYRALDMTFTIRPEICIPSFQLHHILMIFHSFVTQRSLQKHSGDSPRCRMSCSLLWMRSERAVEPRICAAVALSSTCHSRSAVNIAISKICSWPSASSTSASSCCRTTRSESMQNTTRLRFTSLSAPFWLMVTSDFSD